MIHQKRRNELLKKLEPNSLIILTTNQQQLRNGDVYYPFRADSNFYYLSGFTEPEAVVVISKDDYIVFLREKNKTKEIWDGERLGVEAANSALMTNRAFSINTIEQQLPKLIKNFKHIYYDPKDYALDNKIIKSLINTKYRPLQPHINAMRVIKTEHEVKIMQQAANITVVAHQQAMQQAKAGLYEYQIASIFDNQFKNNNTEHAYPPIVASGKDSCILHYVKNDKPLKDGELLLIDAGCELNYYASDITRTFPVNGVFSKAQKQIYQIVLDAQKSAIKVIKPGVSVNEPHKIATTIITKGLMKLGILKHPKQVTDFYMHGTGHWLGIDVHDVGHYKKDGEYRKFQCGMVTTVEPGIYIREQDEVDSCYWNIGIRIEDDIVVTKDGNTILTGALIKEIADIEEFMS